MCQSNNKVKHLVLALLLGFLCSCSALPRDEALIERLSNEKEAYNEFVQIVLSSYRPPRGQASQDTFKTYLVDLDEPSKDDAVKLMQRLGIDQVVMAHDHSWLKLRVAYESANILDWSGTSTAKGYLYSELPFPFARLVSELDQASRSSKVRQLALMRPVTENWYLYIDRRD